MATRQIRPKNPGEFELYWTYFGYKDDTPELRKARMQQVNMVGPAGMISLEDGESGVLIQRAVQRQGEFHSTIEMGGVGPVENQTNLVTEVPIRGFWRHYCEMMGFQHQAGTERCRMSGLSVKERVALASPDILNLIEGLEYDYVQCIDDDKLEEWPDYFVDDCIYKVIPRENADYNFPLAIIDYDNKGMLADRVTILRNATVYSLLFDRHIVSNIRVVGEESGVYDVEANYVVYKTDIIDGKSWLFSAGKYLDKIVLVNGGEPKFKEKTGDRGHLFGAQSPGHAALGGRRVMLRGPAHRAGLFV